MPTIFVLSYDCENFFITLTLSLQFEKRVLRIMLRSVIKQALRRLLKVNLINFFRLLSTIKVRKLRRAK
jgi:hypothetical protein